VAVINGDESPFAILGQDLLDGHLPYPPLWDTKPPLVYVAFAVFIRLFGRSIVALRIGGVLCVWTAAAILYLSVSRLWGWAAGWVSALVVIVACAMLPAGQPTVSEHLARVPLSLLLVTLLDGEVDKARAFWCGILLGLCVLIKADTALVAIGVAIIVLADSGSRSLFDRARRVAWLAVGTSAPFFATVGTYAVLGHLAILRATFLNASFAYVTRTSASHRWSIIWDILTNLASPEAGLFVVAVAGVALILAFRAEGRRQAAVLMGMSVTLLAGLVVADGAHGHYVLVEAPVVGVAAGLLVHASERRGVVVAGLCALALVAPVRDLVRRYFAGPPRERVTVREDLAKRIARYLDSRHVAGQ